MEFVAESKWLHAMGRLKPSNETLGLFLKTVNFIVTMIILYFEEFLQWIKPRKFKSLKGEVILITGSAGGLGKEIGVQLATSGAKLVLWDVSSKANAETAQALRDMGAKHVYSDTVDVSERDEIVKAAEKIRQTVGHVTILINNAGIAPVFQFLDLSPSAVKKTFDVNVISQFWTIQEFLPHMIETKHGQIVTIASTMSHMAMKGSAPYFATKHSVRGLIECLKHELVSKGIEGVKFTTAYPFFFKTNITADSGLKLKFRFPSITPFMEVSYVAEKIIQGIRCEQEFIYLPSWFRVYLIFQALIPSKVFHAMIDFFVEESEVPVLAKKPVENNSVCDDEKSHDAPIIGKHLTFLSPIEKEPLSTGKTE